MCFSDEIVEMELQQFHQLLLNRTAQLMDGLGYGETGKLIKQSRGAKHSNLIMSSPFLRSVEAIFFYARGDLTLKYEQRLKLVEHVCSVLFTPPGLNHWYHPPDAFWRTPLGYACQICLYGVGKVERELCEATKQMRRKLFHVVKT